MGQEIERKFLVRNDTWRRNATRTRYRQGFLSTEPERTVRVRIAGDRGTLTIKGKTVGATRAEFEYDIPVADAAELLDTLCRRPLIEKVRYVLREGAHTWEIDVFDAFDLVLAEVELPTAETESPFPPWLEPRVVRELTEDPRYRNYCLATVGLPEDHTSGLARD